MTVEIINDKDVWDKFVDGSKYGLLFHRWDFLKIVEKHTGYTFLPYGVYKGNELIGVFPFFCWKIGGLKLLYSPPRRSLVYVPYMGPVMGNDYDGYKQRRKEAVFNSMIDEIGEEISRLSPSYIFTLTVPRLIDVRPFKWNGYDVQVEFTYIVNIKKPIEELWYDLTSDCKKNIRMCEKIGLEFKQEYDLEKFFSIMQKRLDREGYTYFHRQKIEYVKDIMKTFPENVKMHFLYRGRDVVALGINCEYKKRYILWMGGATVDQNMNYNDYFLWECLKYAKARGCEEFENCGADEKRLNWQKSKLNPSLNICYAIRKSNSLIKIVKWSIDTFSDLTSLRIKVPLIRHR